VHYLINKLQPIPVDPDEHPVVVTLNPHTLPDEDLVYQKIEYAHPMFDTKAIEAQQHLEKIQGTDRIWFAGAWTGYGFHEVDLNLDYRLPITYFNPFKHNA
jgi:predicted NAD/FAD-binding protein